MKKLSIFLFIFILLSLSIFLNASTDEGLIAYYSFNGNANDESGNGNNGTVYGATLTTDRFGNENSAYSFDGVDDYISIQNSSALWLENITMQAFIYMNSFDGYYAIVRKHYDGGKASFCLGVTSENNTSHPRELYACINCGLADCCNLYSNIQIEQETWYSVACTYNGEELKLFINGELDSVEPCSYTIHYDQNNIGIGADYFENVHYLHGKIDDMYFYSRALTESEIDLLYHENDWEQFAEIGLITGVNEENNSNNSAWGDYNNDGYLDLLVVNPAGIPNSLYLNQVNGTFINIASYAGVSDPDGYSGLAWGDYNNDGNLDLYYAKAMIANRLYKNNGDGTFINVGSEAGVDDDKDGRSVAWGDYDNDGDIDLYLVNTHSGTTYFPGVLFRNNSDGTFTDISYLTGLNENNHGHSAAWCDYDNDGDLDIFLVNSRVNNRLYRNDRQDTFTEVTTEAGVVDNSNSVGAAWGDYNNDGFMDIYLGNQDAANKLYKNNGDGTFTNVAIEAGVAEGGMTYNLAWCDFDNDGYLDLYLGNHTDSDKLYKNNGNETFSDVIDIVGIDKNSYGNGFTWGDYNNDGHVDLYLNNSSGANRLYQNNGNDNNWLIIKTVGVISNRSGIGSRVITKVGSMCQTREVDGGSGYGSQQSLPVEFGFGEASIIDTIIVKWPSGITQIMINVPVNQILTITEQSEIYMAIGQFSKYYGDTVNVPINIIFPNNQLYDSAELTFCGYNGGLEFIDIDTSSSIAGDTGWSYVVNEVCDSVIISWLAGANEICNSGILCNLRFIVIGNPCTMVPINLESALFNTGQDKVVITNGGIYINPIPDYGDVDENGTIQAHDAALILKHLIEIDTLYCQGLANADVTNDGTVSALDASVILQYGVGLINDLPYDTSVYGNLIAAGEFSMEEEIITLGGIFELPILIENGNNIFSFEGCLEYDPQCLMFSELLLPTDKSDYQIQFTNEDGKIHWVGAGMYSDGTDGTFITARFSYKQIATDQSTTVYLSKMKINEENENTNVDQTLVHNLVGIVDQNKLPGEFALNQNYPNPFNPTTTFQYELPKESKVILSVFDMSGRLVKTIVNQTQAPGYYSVQWDANEHCSGVYIYRMQAGEFSSLKKCVILK